MNLPPFDPEIAIQAARQGDANAVAALIEHYRPYLRLLAKIYFGKRLQSKLDESDLVQEASLLATRDLANFRGTTEAELAMWLRSILSNVAANARRHFDQQKRSVRLEQQFQNELDRSSAGVSRVAGDESSPSQRVARRERAVVLAEALEELDVEQRMVITMRDLEGYSLEEIADDLGKTRNAVQKIWARAISEMRRILKEMP
jgi:RNA polymerase sigma-70 factor (ECF subfamily)